MTEGHLCFCFVDFILCFVFSPCFFKARLFCDEQWSCFVLYLFHFCNKKEVFIVVQIYLHLVVLGKGQWVLFILTCWQQNGMMW